MEKPVTVTGSEPEVPEQVPSVPRAWTPLDRDRAERWASCAAPGGSGAVHKMLPKSRPAKLPAQRAGAAPALAAP